MSFHPIRVLINQAIDLLDGTNDWHPAARGLRILGRYRFGRADGPDHVPGNRWKSESSDRLDTGAGG